MRSFASMYELLYKQGIPVRDLDRITRKLMTVLSPTAQETIVIKDVRVRLIDDYYRTKVVECIFHWDIPAFPGETMAVRGEIIITALIEKE